MAIVTHRNNPAAMLAHFQEKDTSVRSIIINLKVPKQGTIFEFQMLHIYNMDMCGMQQ